MALLKTHAHVASALAPPRTAAQLLTIVRTGDTEAERRGAALELAGKPDVAAELAACLAGETSPRVREAIVTALVGIGTAAAAAALAEHVQGEDVALRNDAVEALRQMGEASGAIVEALLASPDADVRIFAVNVLETLRHARAPDLLRYVLVHDSEINVGLSAVEAMAQVGGPHDEAALRAFAVRFADEPFVAFAVDAACRQVSAGETA